MKPLFTSTLFLFQLFSLSGVSLAYDLPPPPAKGSAAEIQDFRILHQYQNERTSEQCKAADLQSRPSLEGMFGPSTGILTAVEIRLVANQGDQIIHHVFDIVEPFKNQYHRMRPYNEDLTLHPCVSLPGGSKAYPSGHTAAGIVLANFLAQKFPAKKTAILAQGIQVGINRLIGGVHHPSDVTAGQNLAKQILNEEFK